MGLWLEHRDDKGQLIEREPVLGGMAEFAFEQIPIQEALARAKASAGMPLEKREWALRLSFGDQV